jgi:hypothetical protein
MEVVIPYRDTHKINLPGRFLSVLGAIRITNIQLMASFAAVRLSARRSGLYHVAMEVSQDRAEKHDLEKGCISS